MNYTPAEIDAKYKAFISKRDRQESMIADQGVTEPPEGCTVPLAGSYAHDDPDVHFGIKNQAD